MDRYQRRVQKLREHVLGHNKENEEDIKKEEKTIEEMTVDELKELAKEKGLEGYSKLKRDELVDLLIEGE
ncbi:Rho termination factor N-terminal domain-containing protein [Tissierella sp. MB52-C2]|uniref:Rho termination factor N-terminal domain-containing protein n=1 Tax=Tissierella sp. MB52-C2 TaxID=3070999 RepID=UPI00280A5DFE|nr:Rho termination factor N-terminal domain-containing protein [Tissierella sp. MB52-C2]WMM24053.1 Rho termination factor N-terminal domain-containing protein [Tissierella sp. MB52-C2]